MAEDGRPEVRAGDADRERVAARLREAFAEGRLTMTELDERLARAYGARTLGDLRELTADLPEPTAALPTDHPLPMARTGSPPARREGPPALRGQVASWVSVSLVCVVIWLLTGTGYFWPVWVIGPWGAVIAGQAIRGRIDPAQEAESRRRRRR